MSRHKKDGIDMIQNNRISPALYITEILLKVVLNTITHNPLFIYFSIYLVRIM
jgi:hypothetical protein